MGSVDESVSILFEFPSVSILGLDLAELNLFYIISNPNCLLC